MANGIDFKKEMLEFKRWCVKNRMRLNRSEDGYPIATAIGKYRRDQFCEGYGSGWIGVSVGRDTKKQFTFLNKKLVALGCIPTQIGDFEGVYKIPMNQAIPVAKLLKIVKGKPKVKNPRWLKKNKSWALDR
jgi:hypothetical protein